MNIEFDIYHIYPNLQTYPIPEIDKPVAVIGEFMERTLSHLKDEIEFEESQSDKIMSIKCHILEDPTEFSTYNYPANLSAKVELALNNANLSELYQYLADIRRSISN